jgi:hypothetical protein
MNPQKALRICVVGELVFIMLSIVLGLALESWLPGPLQEWLAAEADTDLTLDDGMLAAFGLLLLLSSIVASVGLFCLQRWAAWLFLFNVLAGYLLLLRTGPIIMHPVEATVDEIATLFSGLVLGLAFFTDALTRHEDVEAVDADEGA